MIWLTKWLKKPDPKPNLEDFETARGRYMALAQAGWRVLEYELPVSTENIEFTRDGETTFRWGEFELYSNSVRGMWWRPLRGAFDTTIPSSSEFAGSFDVIPDTTPPTMEAVKRVDSAWGKSVDCSHEWCVGTEEPGDDDGDYSGASKLGIRSSKIPPRPQCRIPEYCNVGQLQCLWPKCAGDAVNTPSPPQNRVPEGEAGPS